jgi:hypothetical protein
MSGVLEFSELIAGWSSPVARQAHNLKAAGSNPAPATNFARNAGFCWLICWFSRLSSFQTVSTGFKQQHCNFKIKNYAT